MLDLPRLPQTTEENDFYEAYKKAYAVRHARGARSQPWYDQKSQSEAQFGAWSAWVSLCDATAARARSALLEVDHATLQPYTCLDDKRGINSPTSGQLCQPRFM